jgi:hypothetical protein
VKYGFFLCAVYNQIQHKLQMNYHNHTWSSIGHEHSGSAGIGIAATAANPGCSSCRQLAIATKIPTYKCQKCKQTQQQQNPKGGSKRKSKSHRRKKSKSQRRKKSIKRRH